MNCIFSKFIYWNTNSQDLRMWAKIGLIKRRLWKCVLGMSPNPVMGVFRRRGGQDTQTSATTMQGTGKHVILSGITMWIGTRKAATCEIERFQETKSGDILALYFWLPDWEKLISAFKPSYRQCLTMPSPVNQNSQFVEMGCCKQASASYTF